MRSQHVLGICSGTSSSANNVCPTRLTLNPSYIYDQAGDPSAIYWCQCGVSRKLHCLYVTLFGSPNHPSSARTRCFHYLIAIPEGCPAYVTQQETHLWFGIFGIRTPRSISIPWTNTRWMPTAMTLYYHYRHLLAHSNSKPLHH